jgi:hypothetical protein
MVWPKVYAETGDLWQEGNELVVQGKVRLRDSQVQVSCDSVRRYQPAPQAPPAAVPAPVPANAPAAQANGPAARTNGAVVKNGSVAPKNGGMIRKNGNGLPRNGAPKRNSVAPKKNGVPVAKNGEAAKKDDTAVPPAPPAPKRRLVINLSQTDDENRDIAHFNRVLAALREFPGTDEVLLHVSGGGGTTSLRLEVTTGFGPELEGQLVGLVGEGGFRVEKLG